MSRPAPPRSSPTDPAEPAGLWAAPGRVNLIGEHTDYNDGFVLPFALPSARSSAAAAGRQGWTVCSDFADRPGRLRRRVRAGRGQGLGRATWPASSGRCSDAGFEVPPARIALASDVPVGAGVSSSAALESAVLTALVDLGGLDMPVADRPALAQRAENVYVGAPTGIMDQSASIRCQAGQALFLDCRSLRGRADPVRRGRRGPGHPGDQQQRAAPARRRRVRRPPQVVRGGGPAAGRAGAARRRRRRAGRHPRAARRRGDAPPGAARGHRGPAGAGHRGAAARRPDPGDRPAADRVARLDARRLRDHRAGGRRGGRGGAGRPGRTAPG